MNIRTWGYALACVLVPVAWGLAMVWVTNWLERRFRRRRSRRGPAAPESFTLEYHI